MARAVIRRARATDAPQLSNLLHEWLKRGPRTGSTKSVKRAIRNNEVLVAEAGSNVIGFIHFVMHEDVVDGGPNAFITAFYVSPAYRGQRVGSRLLRAAVADALGRGAVGVETSTTRRSAKNLFERHHFKQAMGDIAEVFMELQIDEYAAEPDKS